ncbi:MAG: endonuclease III [Myxococcota bacterium]|nr:endonuclease III [Myxococcota bacterium]
MGGRPRNSTPPQARRRQATAEQTAELAALLAEKWPDAVVELDHVNAYQLLVATILAAQSTDKMINTITPALFERYPDAAALARAEQGELEVVVHRSGFFRMKAKHLIAMARAVVERHGGQIPETMEALVALPGVARKTANVVLGCALGKHEGVIVDTHVTRVAARLGLTAHTDPVKIEQDLMQLLPRAQWTVFANRLIWHGRRVCHAKRPDCENCLLAPLCPSAAIVNLPPTKQATQPVRTPATKAASRGRAAANPARGRA